MTIPSAFCWTRFGTEAGEPIESILDRKERERRVNAGVFLWGVGNSIRPSILALVSEHARPAVRFSPMLSRPAARDVAPSRTVVWTSATGLTGSACQLPAASVVTSALREERPRSHHYALVCGSDRPLELDDSGEQIRLADLRNWCTGTSIGTSQVTCVARYSPAECDEGGPTYTMSLAATLVPPYFVRLGDPVPVPPEIERAPEHSDLKFAHLLSLRHQAAPGSSQPQLPLVLTG